MEGCPEKEKGGASEMVKSREDGDIFMHAINAKKHSHSIKTYRNNESLPGQNV